MVCVNGECGSPLNAGWRDVVKNKINPALVAFIHDAVLFLVIDFVNVTNRHALGSPIDHEAHSGVGINRDVNPVTRME